MALIREIQHRRDRHRFIFRYELGSEPQMVDALIDLANRKVCGFDQFDAMIISSQMEQNLAKAIKPNMPPPTN